MIWPSEMLGLSNEGFPWRCRAAMGGLDGTEGPKIMTSDESFHGRLDGSASSNGALEWRGTTCRVRVVKVLGGTTCPTDYCVVPPSE